MPIPILFEDENYLVINKPAGLVVHADGRTKELTVADWLIQKYPAIKDVGEPWHSPAGETVYRPGIVHRLDRETSGALVIAKTEEAYLDLKEKFQGRNVEKMYNAFVYGEMNEVAGEEGIIDRPIAKSRKDFRQWSAGRGGRGESRPAVTEYKVLGKISAQTPEDRQESVASKNALPKKTATKNTAQKNTAQKNTAPEQGFTYLEVRPKTGRTHQIRVHFKAINHPVVHDRLYASKHTAKQTARQIASGENTGLVVDLGFERTALHARLLSFTGLAGKEIAVEAPLPDDFKKALTFFPPLNS
jgi:23S rRNA pseudouridine1911/1915/1917 synthase